MLKYYKEMKRSHICQGGLIVAKYIWVAKKWLKISIFKTFNKYIVEIIGQKGHILIRIKAWVSSSWNNYTKRFQNHNLLMGCENESQQKKWYKIR